MPKPPTRTVEGFAVTCPVKGATSAFENKDKAISWKKSLDYNCGAKHKIIPCTISYTLPPNPKKK